jgi:hypothetical protein
MKLPRSSRHLAPWLGAVLALHCALALAVPTTEPLEIDPDMAADIAKQKARANSMRDARQKDQKGNKNGDKNGADSTNDCGSVNIGNVIGNRRIGFAPVDINVIVLGDILNINNKCK